MEHDQIMQVLNDPLAQKLLQSDIPARLAYTGTDGFPRAIPIGYYWNGEAFIMATVPHAPKVRALRANPRVALTVDTVAFPPHVLLVRGHASLTVVDGVPYEYLEASKKSIRDPQQFAAFEAQVRGLYKQMARIAITPVWVKLLDFEDQAAEPCRAVAPASRRDSILMETFTPPRRALHLRITAPNLAAREPRPVEFGAQDRQRALYPGTLNADGTITFDVTVSVVRHAADGCVRYRGPFIHGAATEPYLYLSVRPVGAEPGTWCRRFKVRLPVLTWDAVEALPETAVLATDATGGRHPTLPLHMYEWTRHNGSAGGKAHTLTEPDAITHYLKRGESV